MTGIAGPLADRPFRCLWLAGTISAVGSAFVPVAMSFAVLGLDHSATSLGLVLMVGTIAGLVSYLAGGVWADRVSRRNIMLAADITRLAVEAGVAVLLLTRHAQVWELACAYGLTQVASSFFDPASIGLMPLLVPAGQLQKANSLLSVSRTAASIAGPALSGLLVAGAGPGWAFAADAASFAGSAAFLLFVPSLAAARTVQQSFSADLSKGWHEVTSRTWAWVTLSFCTVGNMAVSIFLVLGPVLALSRLGGASGWGLVSTGLSVGGFVGGLGSMWVKARRPIADGSLAAALVALPMLALAAGLPLAVVVVAAAAGMPGAVFFGTNWDTAVQQLVPTEVLSRFRSFDSLLAFTAMPVGYAVAGPLASAFGASRVLLIAGLVMIVTGTAPALIPAVRAVVRQPDGAITGPGPLRTANEPAASDT